MNEEDHEHRDIALPPPLPDVGGGPPPRLLGNRPFLWLVVAEGFAGVALWGYFVAVFGDAAYRFDATPGQMGILLASFSIVFIPMAPAFGTLADRWSPQRMLILAALGSVGALALAFFARSVPWLYLSMGTVGLAHAAVMPARGALIPRLVEPLLLVRANGMMSASRDLATILGPALGGLAVGLGGRRAPYLVALGAVALAIVLYRIVPDRRVGDLPETSFLRDLARGLRVGMRVPVLRLLFAMGAALMFLVGLLQALEPLYVRHVLDRGQAALGFIWSTHGAGAFLASLALIRLRRVTGREMAVVAWGTVLSGVGFLAYTSGSFPAAVGGTFVFGMGFVLFFTTGQALIQRISSAPGKVTSVFVVLSEVGPLVSALLVGVLGDIVVQAWLVGSAAAFLGVGLVGVWLIRRPALLVEDARVR